MKPPKDQLYQATVTQADNTLRLMGYEVVHGCMKAEYKGINALLQSTFAKGWQLQI